MVLTIPTDFMIVNQKLAKKTIFYLYISRIWILNRKPDNPIEGYLPRRFNTIFLLASVP